MTRSDHAQCGFTLVEVMVSITVLSMILLATVSALRTFGNTQTSLQSMTHRVDEVRSVSGFLRGAIESTVVPQARTGGLSLGGSGGRGVQRGGLLGNGESLQWKSILMFGESYGGSFLLRVAREDNLLMLRWLDARTLDGPEPDWGGAQGWPLVEGLQEFSVAYRGEPGGGWVDYWAEDDGAVRWVRMSIKSKNRFWPELIMQVPQ
ncbi:MAG: prepilin-type N-terminal cleavage/methylation domain-containing protein [Pseudomonadota bacterium]